MQTLETTKISLRIKLARQLIRHWPFGRGRGRIASLLLSNGINWPKTATFRFRYGVFVNTPVSPWPKGYRDLFIYGILESWEVEIWRRVLRLGDSVVDGGANYGYWSLVASTLVGKTGTVHAFEPVPTTYTNLQANLRASKADNVRAYSMALSDQAGKCAINLSGNDPIGGQASLRNRMDAERSSTVEVQLVTLVATLDDMPIRLIKLDIEGGELAALKGALPILSSATKPIVTFEWNRTTAAAFGYTPEVIGEFLAALDYTLFLATSQGLIPFDAHPPQGLGSGWIPMVWALTAQHIKELGICVTVK